MSYHSPWWVDQRVRDHVSEELNRAAANRLAHVARAGQPNRLVQWWNDAVCWLGRSMEVRGRRLQMCDRPQIAALAD